MIIRRIGEDFPVYEVKAEDGTGRLQTLHRNLLLPCEIQPHEHGTEAKRTREIPRRATKMDDKKPLVVKRKRTQSLRCMTRRKWPRATQRYQATTTTGDLTKGNRRPGGQEDVISQTPEVCDQWQQDLGVEELTAKRPRRTRQPPVRLTYDTLGEPRYCRTPVVAGLQAYGTPMPSHAPVTPLYQQYPGIGQARYYQVPVTIPMAAYPYQHNQPHWLWPV